MTWPWQRSIQARIVLILAGLLSFVLLLVNLGMGRLLSAAQLEETANHLQIQALLAAGALQDPLSGYRRELEDHEEHEEDDEHELKDSHLPRWATNYARETGSEVTVVDSRGNLLVGSGPPITAAEWKAARSGKPLHRWTGETIYATAPIRQEDHTLGLVRLALPQSEAALQVRTLSLGLAAASLLALALALVAAVLLSRRLVGPLKRLEQNALKASRGDWEQAVLVEGQDELASLSRAFATMLSELREMLARQRRFVSNASHELRTPLTRIKLRSEALVDGALEDPAVAQKFAREIDSEIDRLARLTNSLLDLSRLEEKPDSTITDEPVHVLSKALETLGEDRARVEVILPDSLPPVRLSPESLEMLVVNLLNNAVKYGAPDGKIVLRGERMESGMRLMVEDEGEGIPPQHLPHLFDRFYRSDAARSRGGTGLGLALVKAAAESAGGSVRVESEAGKGSRFIVDFPSY